MNKKSLDDIKRRLEHLFYSNSSKSVRFNRFLLFLNAVAIFLFLIDPTAQAGTFVHVLEFIFGIIFLLEYFARIWIAERRISFAFEPMSLVDLIVIVSLFAPVLFGNFAFLRVVRALRILRTYRMLRDIRKKKTGWYSRNEDVVNAVVNLAVFVFIMTDIVYVVQSEVNDQINSYIDALYFTLTTLTTTGFGDITPEGSSGRILTILIMVFGITLFVNLARSVFKPQKAHVTCPDCGLNRHDPDAAHCKHCGKTIYIETEGE